MAASETSLAARPTGPGTGPPTLIGCWGCPMPVVKVKVGAPQGTAGEPFVGRARRQSGRRRPCRVGWQGGLSPGPGSRAKESEGEVHRAIASDAVVTERPAVLQGLPAECQTLIVGRDGLLIPDKRAQCLHGGVQGNIRNQSASECRYENGDTIFLAGGVLGGVWERRPSYAVSPQPLGPGVRRRRLWMVALSSRW